MSCLLPQFNCKPDTFSAQFNLRSHSLINPNSHLSKTRDTSSFVQCVLSTTSPSTLAGATTVISSENLRITSLDANSDSMAATRPWTYTGTTGPPAEVRTVQLASFQAALASESLLTSEEAVIAAAAAEAVSLAKAAVKVAEDAAMLVRQSSRSESTSSLSFEADGPDYKLTNSVRAVRDDGFLGAEIALLESCGSKESDEVGPTDEELRILQEELSNGVVVRSQRQSERRARRDRAAKKASANVMSVKSGSNSRKKRGSLQDVDYSDPLRYLRTTTSGSRLLTANEETVLSKGIQELLKLERLRDELVERCGCQPTFEQWAVAAGIDPKTLRRRISNSVMCKEKMIKSNIRLVISIAKNYQGVGMHLQDLVQEGCRGLVKGAEKFDASKGFKFSTYAQWWIKQAIRKLLSDQSRTIRLPFHMVEATYRVKKARKQFYTENGRHPNDEEVAKAAGLSMKRLSSVMLTPKAPLSLDQKIGFNQNLKPSEVIADPDAQTSNDVLIKQLMKKDLENVLDGLNPREKQVIRWRFGIEDGRMRTLQAIGELMGVSRERIRQIEMCAFQKLKNKKRTKHLQQYLVS